MERECKWCDRGWAAIGFVFGALVIVISLDLMLNGRLSELVSAPTTAEDNTTNHEDE